MSTQPKRTKKAPKRVEAKTTSRHGSAAVHRNGSASSNGSSSLRASAERSDPGAAFLPDPYDRKRPPARAGDPFAESLAENYVASATSAEEVAQEGRDEVQPEELGGPFTETTAREEFAAGSDESNPDDAAREPFPTATRLPN